jgi:DNA polymerase/3'-5' exonuclease PolX
MSTTTTKRPYELALADAEAFRDLFPPACYQRWEFAGSVRRRRPEVGDVEHVIIPSTGTVASGDLFGTPEQVNLLWFHLDCLVRAGSVEKATYGEGASFRWGSLYRGALFRGIKHELFTAGESNWGAILSIRTGPADFSQKLVTRIKDRGVLRMEEGQLRQQWNGKPVKCPDETAFFEAAGMAWIKPEERH